MNSKILFIPLIVCSSLGFASPWDSSPNNWDNSSANFQNSPHNWENSPSNWKNSKNNFDSNRVVRDSAGNPIGYSVQKPDGGSNMFDFSGNRKGYIPPK
jgi:hypothetical protein